jgi:predicted nucleic acid-binding protein
VKRLWVDANVILRFVTKDPPALAARAARLMAKAEQGEVSLYLPTLVLAEVVWVLQSFYQYSIAEIARVLTAFVSAAGVEVEEREVFIRTLELARTRKVDFVDAYLAVRAAQAAEPVCTFDKTDFRRLPVAWVSPE